MGRRHAGGGAPPALRHQAGGAGLEFALLFPLFFTLLYAIVGYGLVYTLELSLTEASKEGARAAIKVDPTTEPDFYGQKVAEEARAAVAQTLAWLPAAQRADILGAAPAYSNVGISLSGSTITVTLTYHYAGHPLIPPLSFPLIGDVPAVPDDLVVNARAEL